MVPVIALTASATPLVQKDIIEKLAFAEHASFFSTFTRPNLSFSVFEAENKMLKTIDILKKLKGSSLVYCRNRRRTKELSEILNTAGLVSDYYHAGLEQEVRNRKQEDWIQNKTAIMVCTNAFGMGIDKADVRCVIHYDTPDTPEAYYQEAGRAGRDGHRSYAVLLYQKKDLIDLNEGIMLKYPDLETMRNIYEGLAYYFQVAIDDGLETMHDFDVVAFSKKFNFNVIEVLSTIKLLEQQGYWTLSDSVFLPSRISVTCTKQDIENLEKLHPELDEIIKHVLRMYSGIWYHYIPVNELHIAQNARVGRDYVQLILRKLNALGIIDYAEAKDQPQLFYLHERVPKNQLKPDMELIRNLKERYEERVAFMLGFAEQQNQCRANSLVGYFKEIPELPCGICDICLSNRRLSRQQQDFDSIKNNILTEIELSGSMNIDLFCKQYSSLLQEHVMKTIRFLLDERQLELNTGGDLIKKK
jgi:ATP-dependent DNA helicase RecQ